MLALPIAFTLLAVYRSLAVALRMRAAWMVRVLAPPSWAVLGAVPLHWISLACFGPARIEATLGRGYGWAELAILALSGPGLLNLLVLLAPEKARSTWAVLLAALLAWALLFQTIGIDEALHGVDGSGGH